MYFEYESLITDLSNTPCEAPSRGSLTSQGSDLSPISSGGGDSELHYYQATIPPPPSLHRWTSESEESLDDCPAPPMPGLRRWASEGCYDKNQMGMPKLPQSRRHSSIENDDLLREFVCTSKSDRLNTLKRHVVVFGKSRAPSRN